MAARLNVRAEDAEDLAAAARRDLLARREAESQAAAQAVLQQSQEPYRRLA